MAKHNQDESIPTITPGVSLNPHRPSNDAIGSMYDQFWQNISSGNLTGNPNFDPHDPTTFDDPYQNIQSYYTPEQLNAHINQGIFNNNQQWKQFDLWYNSETQKIKRLLSAGLNPDLIGLDSASTNSSSPIESSGAGSLAVQESQLALQRYQAINQTMLGVAGTIVSAVGSLFNFALGAASTAASVAVNVANAHKINQETANLKTQNTNLVASLDIATESMAVASAMNDINNGYVKGMSAEQIAKLIKFDGKYHENPTISNSIASHKKRFFGNIDFANRYLSEHNDVSTNNIKSSILDDYYIPGSSAHATLRPLLSTAVDLFTTDTIFQRDFLKFKSAIVNGADEQTIVKLYNQSWKNQLDYSLGISRHIPKQVKSTAAKWDSDYYSSLNTLDYNKSYYARGTSDLVSLNAHASALNDNAELDYQSNEIIMRVRAQTMLARLQAGQYQVMDSILKKSADGSINILDAATVMYYNSLYKNTYNSIRSFETSTGASESVTDGGIGAAAMALGTKLLTK